MRRRLGSLGHWLVGRTFRQVRQLAEVLRHARCRVGANHHAITNLDRARLTIRKHKRRGIFGVRVVELPDLRHVQLRLDLKWADHRVSGGGVEPPSKQAAVVIARDRMQFIFCITDGRGPRTERIDAPPLPIYLNHLLHSRQGCDRIKACHPTVAREINSEKLRPIEQRQRPVRGERSRGDAAQHSSVKRQRAQISDLFRIRCETQQVPSRFSALGKRHCVHIAIDRV